MNIFRIVIDELAYGGIKQQEFYQVRKAVDEANRRSIFKWSICIGLFWAASLLIYLKNEGMFHALNIFFCAFMVCVLTLLMSLFVIKRIPWLLRPTMYAFEISLLAVGIGLAIVQPTVRTATMIAVVVIIPICFIDRTLGPFILDTVAFLVYFFFTKNILEPDVYSWGLLNLIIFSLAGLITGHMINKSRFERYVYAVSAQKLADIQVNYNVELQKEVTQKTEKIVALHDQLIMGMATMVESRDNSTGGHIKRTSAAVRFLVETMKEDKSLKLNDEFVDNLIKAAPMHDLGKIAVDDAILRKPGRYTLEEYDQMKIHAAEGAKIIHNILKDNDDVAFAKIAENVAHYHHERWDGKGYPDKLKGNDIPLEARIMAIADVYDALVSERVYKERYSFAKANQIILDGMGSQFDPNLKKYYELARAKLEAYYASEQIKSLSDN